MKNILVSFMVGLSLCVTSCVYDNREFSANDILVSQENNTDTDSYKWHDDNDGLGYYCYSYLYDIEFNNHHYLVSVPSLCDPNTYIYKGDPGPDFGEEYTNLDAVLKEQIVNMVIVNHSVK